MFFGVLKDRSCQEGFNCCFVVTPVSASRGHDYKLLKRRCRSHARLTFFSFRVVTLWNNLPIRGVCSITEYFQRKIGHVLGPPLLFFGSERVWTATASKQPVS